MTSPLLYTYMPSPIGRLLLCGDELRLSGLYTPPASEDPGAVRGMATRRCTVRSLSRAARGVFRRRARRVRRSARPRRRDAFPPERLAATARDPVRHDDQLRRARPAARQADRRARGRRGERPQSDLDHRPLPPRDRLGRKPHRLRRRPRAQAIPAAPRGRRVRPARPHQTSRARRARTSSSAPLWLTIASRPARSPATALAPRAATSSPSRWWLVASGGAPGRCGPSR